MDATQNFADLKKAIEVNNFNQFLIAVSKIDSSRIIGAQLAQAMKSMENNFDVFAYQNLNREHFALMKAELGVFWAITIATCLNQKPVTMTGQWESVLLNIINLIKHWDQKTNLDLSLIFSDALKPWALRLFSDHKLCPNVDLRLEILRLISIWPGHYLQDTVSGKQVAAGLVNMSTYLNLNHHRFVTGGSRTSLFYPLHKVLIHLHKYGHLNDVVVTAVRQVRNLQVGPEVIFFNRLVLLLTQETEETQKMYLKLNMSASNTASTYYAIVHLLQLLVAAQPTMSAYACPGLAQAAINSLVTITTSFVAVSNMLRVEDQNTYSHLVSNIDNIYQVWSVLGKSSYIYRVLISNYAQSLANINLERQSLGSRSTISQQHPRIR